MSARWVWDAAGQEAVLEHMAQGMADFTVEVRNNVRAVMASIQGSRGTSGWPGKERTGKYVRSIRATTFLNGEVFAGSPVRGIGTSPAQRTLFGVVYTTSYSGHMLELGTAPHEIPRWVAGGEQGMVTKMVIHHPGATRRPHFWQGLAATVPRAGSIFAGAARPRGVSPSQARMGKLLLNERVAE